jgi:hypothetical protein
MPDDDLAGREWVAVGLEPEPETGCAPRLERQPVDVAVVDEPTIVTAATAPAITDFILIGVSPREAGLGVPVHAKGSTLDVSGR